jgi:PEP-CTERM motif
MDGPEVDSSKAGAWKSNLTNWGVYAAAASASLAVATNADASIIYTTLNVTATINSNGNRDTRQSRTFDLAGDLEVIHLTNSAAAQTHYANRPRFAAAGLARDSISLPPLKFFANGQFAKKYALSATIAGGHSTINPELILRNSKGRVSGSFDPNSTGFAGFKTQSGDLGWLKVIVADRNHDGFVDQVTLVDYAYNSVSGTSIKAGDTGLPEPGTTSLALLAAGATGILALRQRRKEVATE